MQGQKGRFELQRHDWKNSDNVGLRVQQYTMFESIFCLTKIMFAAGAKPFIYDKASAKDYFMSPLMKFLKDKAITVSYFHSAACRSVVQNS